MLYVGYCFLLPYQLVYSIDLVSLCLKLSSLHEKLVQQSLEAYSALFFSFTSRLIGNVQRRLSMTACYGAVQRKHPTTPRALEDALIIARANKHTLCVRPNELNPVMQLF